MIESITVSLDNTISNVAPVPVELAVPVIPVNVPTPPSVSKEFSVKVPTPPFKPVFPSINEEVAALNDPEATLVTINEVPPFWK